LAAEKNLGLAITAFQAIRNQCTTARFVLVGDGPLRKRLKIRHPELVLAGVRRDEELAAHYASADIFLFPSLTETFGNVILEAMASGLAIVAFDYAAARQFITHERSGLRVPYQDSAAFVTALQNLIHKPWRIRELGNCAREVAQRCDWNQVYQQLEVIFLRLAA
jgi:glycosyltransferase involved in cell wall biosynthesis